MKFTRKKILGYALVWVLVIVVLLWADSSAEEHRVTQSITSFDIVVESGGAKQFVDEEHIDEWLTKHDIHPLGRTLAEVDLAELERVVLEHSAVSGVNAYVTYEGEMELRVSLRTVVARLRVAGYDMYIAEDGYLMPPVDGYLVAVPVITGNYRPLFESGYVGNHAASADTYIASIDAHFDDIELRREMLYKRRAENKSELRKVEKQSVKRSIFSSDDEYKGSVERLKEKKSDARKIHAMKDRAVEMELRELENEKLGVAQQRQRVLDMVDDFDRLVRFVVAVGNDAFWSSEIVQIELSGGVDSPMQVTIVPRSGDFVVDLGSTENLDGKLTMLRNFYDETLGNIGWDKFEHISLRYDGQVVCR